jgi:hypothetical protein
VAPTHRLEHGRRVCVRMERFEEIPAFSCDEGFNDRARLVDLIASLNTLT